ncbi:MAG: NUDIX domain-containing protein [bacterium]|nr:NUDIX domain-containing protein [Acidimicrobiia bacterium]MCY4649858.1 NUDIX domain-containing protein [bacterium]
MPPRASAGLLIYRRGASGALEVLLGHYGGPFWARRDRGAWTVFKGRGHQGETPLETAIREFEEETGWEAPPDPWLSLPQVKAANQVMTIWAVEADFDPAALRPGMFSMEWPLRSGKFREFPEIDRAQWFSIPEARIKMPASQTVLLDYLAEGLRRPRG